MMPRPIYDAQTDIPKGFEDEYVEKEGKWHPKPPSDELGEKGKETLRKEREARDREKARAETAEKERDELKRAAEAAEKGVTREALDKINKDTENKFKPVVDENATLKAELRKVRLEDRLEALFLKSGGKPERWAKAKKDLLSGRVDLTDDGKDFVVKDENGNVTSETAEAFLGGTYKKEAPFFYVGVNSSGSGAEASDGGSGSDYDPVKAGKAAAAEQKNTAKENALAFK